MFFFSKISEENQFEMIEITVLSVYNSGLQTQCACVTARLLKGLAEFQFSRNILEILIKLLTYY